MVLDEDVVASAVARRMQRDKNALLRGVFERFSEFFCARPVGCDWMFWVFMFAVHSRGPPGGPSRKTFLGRTINRKTFPFVCGCVHVKHDMHL